MLILVWIFAWLIGLILPIALVVIIFRAITHRGHKGQTRPATYRDLMLATVALAAAYAGGVTIYYLPPAIFGVKSDNAVFAGRLVLGVLLLVAGLMIRHLTGVFLMAMGLVGLLFAAPFVFNNLGSAGALIAAALAFIVLVVFAIRISRKSAHHMPEHSGGEHSG